MHQLVQRRLHEAFGLVVQRRGGLVQHQDRRVLQKRPGNRQALPLAAREPDAVVANHRVDAIGQRRNELGEIGRFQRCPHIGLAGAPPAAIGHVVGNGVVEEHHLLAHPGNLPAQALQLQRLDGDVVEQDASFRHRVEARNEIGQRGLAATRAAHQRHRLARLDLQVDALERQAGAALVAEAHALEAQRALGPLDLLGAMVVLDGLVDEMEHRIGRREGTLQLTVHVGQVLERVQDHQHGGQERHEAAHRGAVLLRLVERQRDHQRYRHCRHHLRDGHQQR